MDRFPAIDVPKQEEEKSLVSTPYEYIYSFVLFRCWRNSSLVHLARSMTEELYISNQTNPQTLIQYLESTGWLEDKSETVPNKESRIQTIQSIPK